MKLLVDMNLSPQLVSFLATSGIEATHWSKVGVDNAPDPEITACARAKELVVLTQDLDFRAILAVTQGLKPSVVQIRSEDLDFTAIGGQVVAAVLQMTEELEKGALLSIDPNRVRLRLLPLEPRG
jgi:predicted nuclease of predicted toxin-antitoxin system